MAAAGTARRAGMQVEAGGALGGTIAEDASRRSEAIGIAAAIVILAFTFGAMVAAGLPIVTALVGLAIGLGLVGLLGHVVSVPTVAPKLATMIGLGVGIDYALFIVFRHRDQLHRGMAVHESIARTIATSGSAVVFAGATVVVALLALLVADVPLLGAMGYAAALTVIVAVAVAVTLVPALLAVVGRRLDSLRLPGRRGAAPPRPTAACGGAGRAPSRGTPGAGSWPPCWCWRRSSPRSRRCAWARRTSASHRCPRASGAPSTSSPPGSARGPTGRCSSPCASIPRPTPAPPIPAPTARPRPWRASCARARPRPRGKQAI